jgi:very-short-patch-repair endonuclease
MSYAERYFSKIFRGAQHNLHVNRYFLDFAWPATKVYIEIDGEQHYTPLGIAHDIERTRILQECGWTLIKRIRWSEFQALLHHEKRAFISLLLQEIAG